MALTEQQKTAVRNYHRYANELITHAYEALNIILQAVEFSTARTATDIDGEPVTIPAFDPTESTYNAAAMVNKAKAECLDRIGRLQTFLAGLPELPE